MAVLEKTCTINAPVDKVFSFLINPKNWKEIDPNIIEIRNVQSLPNGGYRLLCKYKLIGGLHSEYDIEYTDVISNELFSYRYTCFKYIKVHEVLSFKSENGKTNLTYKIINNVHIPLINALIEKLFIKMYEPTLPRFLANLKAKTET
jgi:Polyketide cyclase / dehydrase and lipid transport